MPDDIRANSWNEISDLLFAEAWQKPIHRFRSPFVFRGQADAGFDLTTSLMRVGANFAEVESPMLRAFRRYAHRWHPGGNADTAWNWLALAQHHGLPTRLLDWTYSPLVALHFATAEVHNWQVDGAVWCVDFARLHAGLPKRLQGILEDEGAGVFTAEMLAACADSLAAFDGLAPEPFLLFWEPPSFDDRIVNQFALFSLASGARVVLGEWLRAHGDAAYRRVVIPAALKPEIRDRLGQAGITERVLLPGLDGLSAWLRRYYSCRSPG